MYRTTVAAWSILVIGMIWFATALVCFVSIVNGEDMGILRAVMIALAMTYAVLVIVAIAHRDIVQKWIASWKEEIPKMFVIPVEFRDVKRIFSEAWEHPRTLPKVCFRFIWLLFCLAVTVLTLPVLVIVFMGTVGAIIATIKLFRMDLEEEKSEAKVQPEP